MSLPPRRFRSSHAAAGLVLVALSAGLPALALGSAPAPPAYERDVLPLFRARCQACHGDAQPRAGLSVRSRADLIEGGHGGPAVVPGAPEKSMLYRMLADGRMPQGGRRFTATELKTVESWIRAGAVGAPGGGHWAFRAPVEPKLPAVNAKARVRNPIDQFVLASLEQKGLGFAPEADRRVLIRRVTYDLVGVPPTPAEIDAFLADRSADAYEKVVDRLLADPRFGERWARHWLDTAGYADSEGVLQEDRLRPNAWRYRDYVIRAFNQDKPYDQFLKEQLAGDELVDYRHVKQFTPDIVDTLAATGFLRNAVDGTRADFNAHQYGEYQYRMLHDTQTIVASTVMGLTVQCSRCHDHKYEPLSQRDYYRVQALFTGAVRPHGALLPSAARQITAATPEEQAQAQRTNAAVDTALAQLTNREAAELRAAQLRYLEAHASMVPEPDRAAVLAAGRTEPAQRTAQQVALLTKHRTVAQPTAAELAGLDPEAKKEQARLQADRRAEEAKRVTLPTLRAFYDQDAAPPATPILLRGDWLHPGEAVEPGIPAVLENPSHPFRVPEVPQGALTTGRRLAFAEWLTRPEHPLTARVMANRLWAHHFGVGIVPTVENFGRSGAKPSHRALLDWLAVRLPRGGEGSKPWSLKSLHRLIVTSSTYRQGSAFRADAAKIDPDDRLLWRQRPRRLEAEAIRDGMLAVTGTLDPTMYGEPVNLDTRAGGEIVAAGEERRGRRSVYLLVRRTQPVTLLNSFDAPVMEVNCIRRSPSVTATQALALMNSGFIAAQAHAFAAKVRPAGSAGHPEVPPPDGALVDQAYLLALGRMPSASERTRTLEFLASQSQLYRGAGKRPAEADEQACADFCQALLSSNEFIYLD